MLNYKIPWAAWMGDGFFELDFPAHWDVRVCNLRDAPVLQPIEISAALKKTISAPWFRQLVARAKTVAIALDDLSRPTPAYRILPFLLQELIAAGIAKENITFIVALGSHTPLSKKDLVKKLGSDVVSTYSVINHDCTKDLVDIGCQVGKVPIRINAAFMAADFRILLGCVAPHVFAGFSGGAKMVLPGLAGLESIEWTHKAVLMGLRGRPGTAESNPLRREFEKVARQVGIHCSIQVVVNSRREIAGIFTGGLETAHRQAIDFAAKVCSTDFPLNADLAILNAYPKDDELVQAENAFMFHHSAPANYLKEDGLVLVTSACSHGIGHHGLFGVGQRLYRKPMPKAFLENHKMVACMPGVNKKDFQQIYWEGYPHFDTWEKTRAFLIERFPNGARVSLFPCSSIQIAGSENET